MTHLEKLIATLQQELAALKAPITRLMGNPNASLLLVAPQPGPEEVNQNLPWCDVIAHRFFELLQTRTTLSPSSFLVLPASFTPGGRTINAKNSTPVQVFIDGTVRHKLFKGYICIGGQPFSTYFGHGRKPDMGSLAGRVMRMVETNYAPLLVFPELDFLADPPLGSTRSEHFHWRRIQELRERQFVRWDIFTKLETLV